MTPRKYSKKRRSLLSRQSSMFDFSGHPDTVMFSIIGILLIFGLLMVYSASFISNTNPFHFFIRQILYVVLGGILGALAYGINPQILPKLIMPGIVFAIFLLIIVLIPGVGKEINGASRWIDLKFFDLQPSEVAKITFIAYLAAWAAKQKKRHGFDKQVIKTHLKEDLLPFISILGGISILVLLEPDLATTGIIGITAIAVYFLSGRDTIHSIGTVFILILMILSGIVAGLLAPYRFKRIQTYVEFLSTGEVQDPLGAGFQLNHIITAVVEGGIYGVGFGEGKEKITYLGDTGFSDNIFAVIAEEFGLIGGVLLSSTFLYMIIRGLKIAGSIPDRFGKLLASGVMIWIVLQAFLHIGANIGMIPVTGIPLPFLSYGGSSVVVCMVAIGLYLNVSRQARL